MKAIQKMTAFFSKNKVDRPKSKKDANLKYNSTLYFQFSLVISIIAVALVINGTYGVTKPDYSNPFPDDYTEVWLGDVVIIEPEKPPVEEVKPEKPKKVNPVKVNIVETPTANEADIETDPEPDVVHTDNPVVAVTPPTTPAPPDDNIYSLIGVERVPVFPGCEMLTDNSKRRDCMSAEIGKIINRRFNKELAGELGLTGNQRIYVSFVIDKKGELGQLQVRAPHPRLEREAERVVKMIPKMMPGLQNNREVDVMFTLPIIFNVVN
jgi:periplasmic protein TonB